MRRVVMRQGNICCYREIGAAPRDRAWLIEAVAFALFLVLAGILIAVPDRQWAPFALGLGTILLGKNLVRHMSGMRVRHIGVIIGSGALVAGLAGLAFPDLPLFAIFMVATGMAVLGRALLEFARRS
jgi:hypothetical protein